MVLKAKIVRIGNSQGIRIPRLVLDETGLSGEVELEVLDNEIIIRADRGLRDGWSEAFSEMASKRDDVLLDESAPNDWDVAEWEWK